MALDLSPKGTSMRGVCEPIPLKEFGAGQLVSIQLAGFMAFKAPVEAFFSPYTNLVGLSYGFHSSQFGATPHLHAAFDLTLI